MCVLAKTLQLCPTLSDPMDCSPPGFSAYGLLQAGTLEWVAMPSSREIFPTQGSNLCLWHVDSLPLGPPAWVLSRFSRVRLFATLWTVASQASMSMGFSRPEYWSGLPYPSPGR